MSTSLHLVYQYRQLAVKCERRGLNMAEVELLETIEALFSKRAPDGRRHSTREEVSMVAELRMGGRRDRVAIENVSLGGMVCHQARGADVGDTVEVVIDDDELCLSYRFKADVCWSQGGEGDDEDRSLGLRFCGSPLLLRHAPPDEGRALSDDGEEFDVNTVVDADCAAA